jgi:Endomembrane protein 70
LLALWLGILVPLTYLGAYAGNYVTSPSLPTTPRTVLLGVASYRSIRNGDRLTKCLCVTLCLWFNIGWLAIGLLWLVRCCLVKLRLWRPELNGIGAILVGGVFCFGSIFVEVYYIMSAVWMKYYYSTYGFLLSVAVIFFWTCGVVAVLFNYVNLTLEAAHSWWWQFLCSGAAGIWLAFYSILYGTELLLDSYPSVLLYGGFMAWVSLAVFLMTGFVGFVSSILFVRTIFAIGKAGTSLLQAEQGIDLSTTKADETTTIADDEPSRVLSNNEPGEDDAAADRAPTAAAELT